nr:MAG TPA: hypothetical protein [Bacteriophage sp.]
MTLDECLKALDYELSRDLEDSERITRLWLTELKMYKKNEFPNTLSLDKMISNLGEAVDEADNQLCKWLKELKNYRVSCR